MDIRQTPEYVKYLNLLGWQTIKINKGQVFVKKFPFFGAIVKAQRIPPPVSFSEIEKIVKKFKAFQIIVESDLDSKVLTKKGIQQYAKNYQRFHYHISQSSFAPTKTIILNINKIENEVLESVSKNKRRDIRAALRGNLVVKEGTIKEYIELKKKCLLAKRILPIGTTSEIQTLYDAFQPNKIKVLIAYYQKQPVAGTIILFQPGIAHYWLAVATKEGKRLLAPTHLVWEAIKQAQKRGCRQFDLEGIYDERFPQRNWLGFTKFKQGFGGQEIYYPPSLIRYRFPSSIFKI